MKPPRISIWMPTLGQLTSFVVMSFLMYLSIAGALEQNIVERKTPDSLQQQKVFTNPVPIDIEDEEDKIQVIRDAIGSYENTLTTVYRRRLDGERELLADNAKDVRSKVSEKVQKYALDKVLEWESEGESHRLAAGLKFRVDGIDYHLIGQRFHLDRGERSPRGEMLLVTNLDTTIAKTRQIFIDAKIRTALVVLAWGAIGVLINVVPIVRLTRELKRGRELRVWWWVPKQISDLADQLMLDREANERFRAEANEFRASIDLRSRVIEFSPVPTFICKLPKDGKQAIVTYANKAVANQFGYDEMVNQPLNILVPPEYWGYHTWDTLYDEDLKRGVGMAGCPHVGASRVIGQQRPVPVIAKGGVKLQALLSVDRIADDEDGSRNFIGTLQDITPLMESREAERVARKKAESLAEEIENVNHIAVHDIKADLTALGKGSEVIEETIAELTDYLSGNDDDILLDAIDTVRYFSGLNINSARNAFEVLDQRNKLYDLDSKIVIKPCAVNNLLDALEAAFSSESGDFQAINDCPQDCQFLADYSLLLTVLKNIARNGFIHNDSPLKRVEVRVSSVGNRSRITVSDNGVGMPAAYLESWGKTLGKAAQLSNRGGSGTGLYSIRKIIDAHPGASIEISSVVGQGTVFTLEFLHVT